MTHEFPTAEIDEQRLTATIAVDKKVYSKSAVLRASYWFSRDLWFRVQEEQTNLVITVGVLAMSPTLSDPQPRKIDQWLPDVFNALVDSQLRVEVQAETASIRELIIAKAFAESGVLEDVPPGTFQDPVDLPHIQPRDLVKLDARSPK